jgi:hypothetical protein
MPIDRNKVKQILNHCNQILTERANHGDETFEVMAKLATIYLGQQVAPADTAMLMSLFKIARIIAGQHSEDHYKDAINYLALALEQHKDIPL